jgi:hypothetical protein
MSSLVQTDTKLDPTCECGKYYKYDKFNNLCSECYINKYGDNIDEKLLLSLISRRPYPKKYLDNIVNSRSLPENHFLWVSLKHMFETGSVIQGTNYLDWVKYLEENTIYKGISMEQAFELKSLSDNSKNQYVKNILKDECWKLGHNICCLIIDWWNIPNNKLAKVQCYYHKNEPDQYPLISDGKIELPPIFNRKCKKPNNTCKNYGNDISKCDISHNHMLEFTIKNLAQNY